MENKRLISKIKGKNLNKLVVIFFIIYISCLLYLTLLSSYYGRGVHHRSVNIVPFKTIIQYLVSDNLSSTITNILGNIVAFVPMGFLLPMMTRRFKRIIPIIPILLLATISVELLQFILSAGASDVDDIILNFLGEIIGFFLYRFCSVLIRLIEGI